jgi:molecular chaperone GrpE
MMDDEKTKEQETAPAAPAQNETVHRLEAELATLNDRLLRSLAEQENVRRRAERAREEAVRFASSDMAKDMLPAVDNLRRALDSVPEERATTDEMMRSLLDGVAATERAMLDALAKHGVSRFEPAPGEPFDPYRHQAMFAVEDDAHAGGTVTQLVQPGYVHGDRLLRPALVGVASHRAGEAAQSVDAAENDQRCDGAP